MHRCFIEPDRLLLAGAHHRGGSEMLTRSLSALCSHCFPGTRGACRLDVDTGRRGLNVSALVARRARPRLRVLSSGQWSLPIPEMARALQQAGIPWRMVHLVRDPFDLILSAYWYHRKTREEWALQPSPAWASRMGLSPPLPAGLSFQQTLLALNGSAGIVFQAQHSARLVAAMVATAEGCAAMVAACTNLWLDSFAHTFDGAAADLLQGLGVLGAARRSLVHVLRGAAHLSEAQMRASHHATRGKHLQQNTHLSEALHHSSLGPVLRRLRARLLRLQPEPGRVWEDAGSDSTCHAAASRATSGWWASAEPARFAALPCGGGHFGLGWRGSNQFRCSLGTCQVRLERKPLL
jgi:hypothetical protein